MARKLGQVTAGTYRQQIALQQPVLSANTFGEQVPTPTTEATLRAEVTLTGGSEVPIAGQTGALTTYTVRHRFYAALTTQWSYLYRGLTLNILSLIWDEKRIEMEAKCIQRDNS